MPDGTTFNGQRGGRRRKEMPLRDEVMRRCYPRGDSLSDIHAELRAIGMVLVRGNHQVTEIAQAMGLKRPPGFTWNRRKGTGQRLPVAKADAEAAPRKPLEPEERERLLAQLHPTLKRIHPFALKMTRGHRETAEDLLQRTAVQALSALDTFDPGSNLAAWMMTIMRNLWFGDYRTRLREVQDADGALAAQLATRPDQLDHLELMDVDEAFGRLTPEHRRALLDDVLEDSTYLERAEAQGISEGTAKSRLSRARTSLQRQLA